MTVSNEATAQPTKLRRNLATWSWALWDWAEQPYPTIIQTFIFATYIVSSPFGDPDQNAQWLSVAGAIAGVIVALTSPIFGQATDTSGRRKRWLLINSGLLIAIMAGSWFIAPAPQFFVIGIALYAIGSVIQETAFINYYAMLPQIATKKNMGKVSGFAWGLGYVGGILLLLISLVGFYLPDHPWFGISNAESDLFNIRFMFLLSAGWMLIFTIPLALFVPEAPAQPSAKKLSVLAAYRALWSDIKRLRRESPDALKFLIASAIYRDGLAGVFTFGAILGSVAFGFTKTEVIFFGIAANVVAGIGAALGGWLDDRVGTKTTIVASLIGLLIAGTGVFAFAGAGTITYWIGGLALCLFVGPAQASSRTFVARLAPQGREGWIFGLYQTTGRAASFLSPSFWWIATSIAALFGVLHTAIYGILGIIAVLAVGMILLLRVHPAPTIAE